MPDLVYTIKTPAELEGAQLAELALERQIGKAKALGKDYTELQVKLDRVRTSIQEYKATQASAASAQTTHSQTNEQFNKVLEETKHKLDEASEGVEGFATHGGAMHKLLHEVSAISPVAGLALKAAFHPQTIGIVGLTLGIEMLVEKIKESRKEAAEFRALIEQQVDLSGLVDAFGAGIGKINEAKARVQEFYNEFNRRDKETSGFKARADAMIAQIARINEAEKKLAEEEAKRDLARLEVLRAQGKISPEDFEKASNAIGAATDAKKGASDKKRETQSNAELEAARASAEITIHTGMEQVAAAEAAAKAAADRLANEQKQLASAKAIVEADAKALGSRKEDKGGETKGLIDEYEKIPFNVRDLVDKNPELPEEMKKQQFATGGMLYTKEFYENVQRAAELSKKIDEVRQNQAGAAGRANFLGTQIPKDDAAAKKADADAKALEKKITDAQTDKKAIEEELARRKADAAATDPIDAKTTAAAAAAERNRAEAKRIEEERKRKEEEEQARKKAAEDADADIRRRAKGGTGGSASAPDLQRAADATVASLNATMQTVAEMLETLQRNSDNLRGRINDSMNS